MLSIYLIFTYFTLSKILYLRVDFSFALPSLPLPLFFFSFSSFPFLSSSSFPFFPTNPFSAWYTVPTMLFSFPFPFLSFLLSLFFYLSYTPSHPILIRSIPSHSIPSRSLLFTPFILPRFIYIITTTIMLQHHTLILYSNTYAKQVGHSIGIDIFVMNG